jgi:hypothetical protein
LIQPIIYQAPTTILPYPKAPQMGANQMAVAVFNAEQMAQNDWLQASI